MEMSSSHRNTFSMQCCSCESPSSSCWCVDCNEALCDACLLAHRRVTLTRSHQILNESPTAAVVPSLPTKYCKVHPSEPLKIFCVTCQQLTCRDCQLVTHMNHRYQFVSEALGKLKRQVDILVQPIIVQNEIVGRSLRDMESRLQDIAESEVQLQNELQQALKVLTQHIKNRMQEMFNRIKSISENESQQIKARMALLKRQQEQRRLLAESAEAVKNTRDLEMMLRFSGQVQAVLKKVQNQDLSPPSSMLQLRVTTDAPALEALLCFGNLQVLSVPFAVNPPASLSTGASSALTDTPFSRSSPTAGSLDKSFTTSLACSSTSSMLVQRQTSGNLGTNRTNMTPGTQPQPAGSSLILQNVEPSNNSLQVLQPPHVVNHQTAPPLNQPAIVQLTEARTLYQVSNLKTPFALAQPSLAKLLTQNSPQSQSEITWSRKSVMRKDSIVTQQGSGSNHAVLWMGTSAGPNPCLPQQPKPNTQLAVPVQNLMINQRQPLPASSLTGNHQALPVTTQTLPSQSLLAYFQKQTEQQHSVFHNQTSRTETLLDNKATPVHQPLPLNVVRVVVGDEQTLDLQPSPDHKQALDRQTSLDNTQTSAKQTPFDIQQATNQEPLPVLKQIPNQEPLPVLKQIPNQEPLPVYKQTPNQEPLPVYKQTPNQEPLPVYKQTPNQEPLPVYKQTSNQEPMPALKQTPNQEPLPVHREKPDHHQSMLVNKNTPDIKSSSDKQIANEKPLLVITETSDHFPLLQSMLDDKNTPDIKSSSDKQTAYQKPLQVNKQTQDHQLLPVRKLSADKQSVMSYTSFKELVTGYDKQKVDSQPSPENKSCWNHRQTPGNQQLSTNQTLLPHRQSLDEEPLPAHEQSSDEEPSPGSITLKHQPLPDVTKTSQQGETPGDISPQLSPKQPISDTSPSSSEKPHQPSPVVKAVADSACDSAVQLVALWQPEPAENEPTSTMSEEQEPLEDPPTPDVIEIDAEEQSYDIECPDFKMSQWQPRVSLYRLPLAPSHPGGPLPQFRLVAGEAEDEFYLEEINEDSESDDDDDVPEEYMEPLSSPDSPLTLQTVGCAACGSTNASIICSACGRGYHGDCHLPPVGCDIWMEWTCSLCQDLLDPSDPYSSDRPPQPQGVVCLSLQEQRRCENLLLHLKVEGCSRLSTMESVWPRLIAMSQRLTHHSPEVYLTTAELLYDIWRLFKDAVQVNSSVNDLQDSFQSRVAETFHPPLSAREGEKETDSHVTSDKAIKSPGGDQRAEPEVQGKDRQVELEKEEKGEEEKQGEMEEEEVDSDIKRKMKKRLKDFFEKKEAKRRKVDNMTPPSSEPLEEDPAPTNTNCDIISSGS